MSALVPAVQAPGSRVPVGPPAWLIVATGLLALGCLAMAVAETSLWMHYLIDAGESISLAGVGFILVAGLYLHTRGRLLVSLPLALPWLLFPVITQGDQIIDNLSINWMRFVSHVLLGLLFGTPVAVVVLGVKYALAPRADAEGSLPPPRAERASARLAEASGVGGKAAPGSDTEDRLKVAPTSDKRVPAWLAAIPGIRQIADGRVREGGSVLAATLLVLEMWVAVRFLGLLMVVTLIVLVWAALAYGSSGTAAATAAARRQRSERFALTLLLVGVVSSVGLFFGYKNRPGAYQGSPSYFMDPAQQGSGFQLNRVAVPTTPPVSPANPEAVRAALTGYARAFERLLAGYYVLDRNYNYHFHNELFLRSTPLLADYRTVGLAKIREAGQLRVEADRAAATARATLAPADPLAALVDDVSAYAAFTFDRAPVLEKKSAEFERTKAGLQHATHIYEGEGKVLGVQLDEIVAKHHAVLSSPVVAPVTSAFVTISRAVHDAYANRIVGF